ncbi:MAG: hypothetical protein ACT4PM_02150 [Gemmatimonadales bacterium]
MGLDQLRARLDRLLGQTQRSRAAALREALLELKVAASQSRDALTAAERELASHRQQLTDAERRGKLAAEIGDTETAAIAAEFAGKHRERIALLERKVAVIRDELAFVEREYEELGGEYRKARQGVPEAAPPLGDLESGRDETERELDALKTRADREAVEQAVKAQLDMLKRKLGKRGVSD